MEKGFTLTPVKEIPRFKMAGFWSDLLNEFQSMDAEAVKVSVTGVKSPKSLRGDISRALSRRELTEKIGVSMRDGEVYLFKRKQP